MKKGFIVAGFVFQLVSVRAQRKTQDNLPIYTGNELGVTIAKGKTSFRLWAPGADSVRLCYGADPELKNDPRIVFLRKSTNGTWTWSSPVDLRNQFYAFSVRVNNNWCDWQTDPYARATGINGHFGKIIDLASTNPPGWEKDKSPVLKNPTDAILYELHVRDASIAVSSGIKAKGKFIGLTETGTRNPAGLSTGLDHLKEMGVTHIHLLPFFDYNSVDETKAATQYNWGYDPVNYNVPEGSYATDPYTPETRIRELKMMIQRFHEAGLSVVMDVVYNHTALGPRSNFNQLVPDYYYRHKPDGSFSDATACGNETASEQPMFRKFMLESMMYWVKEFHVDGFRVDLMGVHDITTMNLISKTLHRVKPGLLIYGEGWTAGASPLPDSLRALKANAARLDHIAVFSDDIRDGIKGSVFDHTDRGFVSGKPGMEESIRFGVVASCPHPQVQYDKVNYSKAPYAREPWNTISYCECHDNHVLWDKLAISAPTASRTERIQMQKLALAIVLTSQGIPFLHAGTEFLRTKHCVENSYASGDSINAIDWNLKTENQDVVAFVKGLIRMRKEHPAFRMTTAAGIASNLRFMEEVPGGIVAFTIDGTATGDSWKKIMVIYNGAGYAQKIKWPRASWNFYDPSQPVNDGSVPATEGTSIEPYSCIIAYQ